MKYTHEDGTPYSKEEFLQKLRTDKEFNNEFGNKGIDQISELIRLLKESPDSRRMVVSAWNISDLPHQVLPPCHYGFQVYTRELSLKEKELQLEKTNCINDIENDRIIYGHDWENYIKEQYQSIKSTQNIKIPTRAISLMFNMRSCDVPLGLPFNIASYALLLEIIGKMVNMVPEELIANLGDAHIYLNQIDGVKEQLTRTPMKLPNLIISDEVNFNGTIDEFLESCNKDSFKLDGYESHPSIKIPLSN